MLLLEDLQIAQAAKLNLIKVKYEPLPVEDVSADDLEWLLNEESEVLKARQSGEAYL